MLDFGYKVGIRSALASGVALFVTVATMPTQAFTVPMVQNGHAMLADVGADAQRPPMKVADANADAQRPPMKFI